MKAKGAFYLSLGLNAVLLAWLVRVPEEKKVETTGDAANEPKSLRRSVPRLVWIDRLRDEGIGEHLIASLAASDYEDRWQKRLLEIQQQLSRGEIDAADMENFVAGHEAGLESRMRDCLGDAGFQAWDRERVLRGFDMERLKLSAPETDDLFRLRKTLDCKTRDLQAALLRGEIDETDLERQTEANHEDYERELKGLLGQARYASLQPGDSEVGELYRDLARAGASGDQVDAALAIQQQWREARARADDERRLNGLTDEEFEQQLRTLDAGRDQRLLEMLGGDTLADLRMHQDGRYQTLQRYAGAWNLGGGDIDYLYSELRDYDEKVRNLRQSSGAGGNPADEEAVEGSLRGLARENEAKLLNYLGAERFARLKKSGVLAGSP
ncbi:hypothetical protein KBB96_11215 [Luteolibacter ambystomatis]|uniref:Uncharacterized protein n=1 Tax=Luteolibacter ambystomatis TaxID=2824561 RepID=A0A975IXQ9_9BACT|nr:hypothetical protein [Luteolibacter ambystomatis]QUE49442.1 hypothetical protein KBB96_11215 [Luteolibacter ambystomatis]